MGEMTMVLVFVFWVGFCLSLISFLYGFGVGDMSPLEILVVNLYKSFFPSDPIHAIQLQLPVMVMCLFGFPVITAIFKQTRGERNE